MVLDPYRVRLEGRAELLETARDRYVSLIRMLSARRWKERAWQQRGLLRRAREEQPKVEEALAYASRRAEVEGWAPDARLVLALTQVSALAERLRTLARRRLGARVPSGASLPALLAGIEREADVGPTLTSDRRFARACALLPDSPLLRRVAHWGELLEALFARPWPPRPDCPLAPHEVSTLARDWAPGEAALTEAWAQVRAGDRGGVVTSWLERQARGRPVAPPRLGPESLVRAEFWRGVARARLRAFTEGRLRPLRPRDDELIAVFSWLTARTRDVRARLPASGALSEGRAGLFELAYELQWLWELPGDGWPAHDEARLRARARRAALADPDALALRDAVRARLFRWTEDLREQTLSACIERVCALGRKLHQLEPASAVGDLGRRSVRPMAEMDRGAEPSQNRGESHFLENGCRC